LPPLPPLENLPEIWQDVHMHNTAHSFSFLGEQIDQASVTNWRITFGCPQRRAIFNHNQSPALDGFSVVQCELNVHGDAKSRGNRQPILELVGKLVGKMTVYLILSPTQLQSFVAAYGALVVDRANQMGLNQTRIPSHPLTSSQHPVARPAHHVRGIAGGAAAGSGAVNPFEHRFEHRAATEAEIITRIENCYELFCKEIKQIGHFSHLTVEMLTQHIEITHHGHEGWAFTYRITDHSSLDQIALGYALHNLLNHALNKADQWDVQTNRHISHDGFMRLITQLESPAYKEAKRRLEFISNQPLETGHKSWWEVIQAETALREQGQPGRLADSLYEALRQHPEADLKTSSVPLLHTALLDLKHHEDRESWKKWLELLFVNLGFKDNKGRNKTFLTGDEEWRTILSEEQAQKISHYTDHILWVIAELKASLSFDGSLRELYNHLCAGEAPQHATDDTMIGTLKWYYDVNLGHHYLPFESASVRSKRYIQTLAMTLQAKARPPLPAPIVDPSTPEWNISFNTFKSMLNDPLDAELDRATQRFQVHIRNHVQQSRDIPHMLHALVSKLREIKANSDPQYADAITSLRIKIKRFNEGDPASGRSDMDGHICLTGIWGRLASLLETLSVRDQLNAFVTTQLSERLKEKLLQDSSLLGGNAENSMHPNFMATFLADKGWGRRPLDPMPFEEFSTSLNRIATGQWDNNMWVTTTLLSGVYDYYEQKINTLLRETQAIEPLLSILQQIDPTFESSRLSTMYYPNSNPDDCIPNQAALMGFVLEHIADIAIREGFLERRPQ